MKRLMLRAAAAVPRRTADAAAGFRSWGLAALLLAALAIGVASAAVVQAQDGAMSDPTLTSDTAGSIVVSWQVPSPEPSDYRLDWAKSGESYTSWRDNDGHLYPAGTATSATITGLDGGTEYKVRIRARYNDGDNADNPWSGAWTGDVLIVTAGQAPVVDGTITGLAATSPQPGTLSVTWDEPNPEPSGYRVRWHLPSEAAPTWDDAQRNAYIGAESHTITGLREDVQYKVQVRARYLTPTHDPTWSGPFADTTARTSYGVPAQPTNLTFSAVGQNQVTLSWVAPANSKVTGYRVQRDTEGAEPLASTVAATPTTYTDTGLSLETEYTYTVTALNDKGAGTASEPAKTTTAAPTVDADLPVPANLTAALDGNGGVTLDWDDPQGDNAETITGYRIMRGPTSQDLQPLVRDTGHTTTSHTDDSAEPSRTYHYAVRSRTATTMSGQSTTLSVANLGAPTGLSGYGIDTAIGLTWEAASDSSVTGYRILRGTAADSLTTLVDNTASTSSVYVDTTTGADATFWYAVQARNAHGLGPATEAVEVSSALPPPTQVFIDSDEEPLIYSEQNAVTTLYSNLEQDSTASGQNIGNTGSTHRDLAVAFQFQTGANASGYTLQSATVSCSVISGDVGNIKLAILADSSGTPGSEIHTLGETATVAGEITISSGSFILRPSTGYWLAAELQDQDETGIDLCALETTASQEPDPGSQPDWSTGRFFQRSTSTASWTMDSSTNRIQFALQGEALPPALISNLRQTSITIQIDIGHAGGTSNDKARAVQFGTGPLRSTLNGVQVQITEANDVASSKLKAAIYTDASGSPGTQIYTVGEITGPTVGLLTIDADTAVTLSRNSTYWLVLDLDDITLGDFVELATTTSGSLDSGAEPGWSQGGTKVRTNSGAGWRNNAAGRRFQFAILGETVADSPTLVSSLLEPSAGQTVDPFVGNQTSPVVTDGQVAVQFSTAGGPGATYTMRGVSLSILPISGSLGQQGNLKAVVAADTGGRPGTSVGTLGPLAVQGQVGAIDLNAATPITLSPNTNYWLVFDMDDMPADHRVRIDVTNSDDETALAREGVDCLFPQFSLADNTFTRPNTTATWTQRQTGETPRIAILGEPATGFDTSAAVTIPDATLRGLIETALGKSSGDTITYAEIATIWEIRGTDGTVASMEGLQYAAGLRNLILPSNRISSPIEFCAMTHLEHLDLRRNDMGGHVDLSYNEALEMVWLSFNRITGLSLPHAPNLRGMTAFNNRLASVATNGHLPNLRNFNLGNNHLTSIDLDDVGGSQNLVNLAHNRLTSINIPGGRGYRLLDLSSNQLTAVTIPWMPNLEYLYLRSNNIASWPDLGNTGRLKRLDLANNRLSNRGSSSNPDVFLSNKSFPQLEDLWLNGNTLNTLQFNSGQMPKLKALYLQDNKDNIFFGNGLFRVWIANAPALTYINVGGNGNTVRDVIHPHARCGTNGLTCDFGGSIGRVAP